MSVKNLGKYAQKGRKLSEEAKKKMSESRKGKMPKNLGISFTHKGIKHTKKAREKMSKARIGRFGGKNHPNWKGGKSKNYHKGKKYIYWRIKVFERDNWTCQFCRERGVYLEAHHIKPWIKYPKLRYEVSNGVTLCFEHHNLVHKLLRQIYSTQF